MRAFITAFAAVLSAVAVYAATVTLAWDPNMEPDIGGYRLYWGQHTPPPLGYATNGSAGTPYWTYYQPPVGPFPFVTNCGAATNWTLDVEPGPLYAFYVTCYNTSGLESLPSNVVEWQSPDGKPPTPTLNLR